MGPILLRRQGGVKSGALSHHLGAPFRARRAETGRRSCGKEAETRSLAAPGEALIFSMRCLAMAGRI